MDRFGLRYFMPIVSMLSGILVVGSLMPATSPIISRSLADTVPSVAAANDFDRPPRHANHLPVRRDVTVNKLVHPLSQPIAAREFANQLAPRNRAPHGSIHCGDIDGCRAKRIRVATRVPESLPRTGLPKSNIISQPEFIAPWPLANSLIEQLTKLADDELAGDLPSKCIEQLVRLHSIESLDAADCADVFDQLRWLSDNATTRAETNPSSTSGIALHRVVYAIERRLVIWEQMHLMAKRTYEVSTASATGDFASILEAVEAELEPFQHRKTWRAYLLLDEARRAFIGDVASASDRRELAQRILRRMTSPKLTERQKQFFERPAIRPFRTELESWASEPVDYASIMRQLEEYESNGGGRDGDSIASAQRALLLSSNSDANELARRLDVHYRNANLRIAVAGELINRLLPEEQQMRERVRDRVLGADVVGDSYITNRLRIRLMPDRQRWRVGIESHGEGNSQTEAERGPVVIGNEGRFRVKVRKLLLVDRRGVRTGQAEAEADSDNQVTSVTTNYDKVPLIGAVVRSIAMNQQANSRLAATEEVNRKLEALARRRMDDEVQARLEQAEKDFQKSWIAPIRGLGLDPKPIQMETTAKRLIARYRLASDTQLAAFTPRPMALANSWLSVQLHESTLNNAIRQLGLDGQTMNLRELYEKIGRKLGREQDSIPEDLPEDVTIRFADQDSATLRCNDGRIQVTLQIAKLTAGRKSWNGFTVQVNYVVNVDGLDIRAARDNSPDDYIAVQGVQRLGNRIAIATIFSKVFSHERQFPIMPSQLNDDPRLVNLFVGQLVVDHGWIGVSIVPNVAETVVEEEARRVRRFFR